MPEDLPKSDIQRLQYEYGCIFTQRKNILLSWTCYHITLSFQRRLSIITHIIWPHLLCQSHPMLSFCQYQNQSQEP
jgi:hypothetical protein